MQCGGCKGATAAYHTGTRAGGKTVGLGFRVWIARAYRSGGRAPGAIHPVPVPGC